MFPELGPRLFCPNYLLMSRISQCNWLSLFWPSVWDNNNSDGASRRLLKHFRLRLSFCFFAAVVWICSSCSFSWFWQQQTPLRQGFFPLNAPFYFNLKPARFRKEEILPCFNSLNYYSYVFLLLRSRASTSALVLYVSCSDMRGITSSESR